MLVQTDQQISVKNDVHLVGVLLLNKAMDVAEVEVKTLTNKKTIFENLLTKIRETSFRIMNVQTQGLNVLLTFSH